MRKTISISFLLVALIGIMLVEINAQSIQPNARGWESKQVEIPASNSKEDSGVLREVRASKHQGYDRVVFEFSGKSVPKSQVRYADPPFNLDESDEIIHVAGKSFLEVVFTPAYAHDLESGQVTVKDPEKPVQLSTLRAIRRVYDHEGQVIYVLGLVARKQFRVQMLLNPSRLVVDVRH